MQPNPCPARLRPWVGWIVVVVAFGAGVLLARPASGSQTSASTVGEHLYLQSCATCHGNQGGGSFAGPTLVGVGAASANYWLRSGRMPIDDPDEEPKRSEPAFSEDEIAALVAHIATFGDGPPIPAIDLRNPDLARGGELYRLNCAACHNWDGKGGALVNRNNAPELHPVPPLQVAEAIRTGPGTMPRFDEDRLSDADLDEVVAYVDYLRAPVDAGGFGLGHWGPTTEGLAAMGGLAVLVLVTVLVGERRRGG